MIAFAAPRAQASRRWIPRAAALSVLPALAALALVAAAPFALAGSPKTPAPEPPPLPAATDARSLYEALPAEARALLDADGGRVQTFAEQRQEVAGHAEMSAISLGTLRIAPEAVRSLLAQTSSYPGWLTLHPSYKRVAVNAANRFVADVGSAESAKAKRTMVYQVETSGDVTTWRVIDSGTALEPGSSISLEVVPHPVIAGASLIIHRQFGRMPDGGRMARYLGSDDDRGRNHWWRDANKHARRLHWALDAALRFPAGEDRKALYLEHYQREFGAAVPYWALTR